MVGRALLETNGLSVVKHIKNTDGTQWCRIWSDGWIEQGGIFYTKNGAVTYLVPFANNNYSAFLQYADNLSATVASSVYASMGVRTSTGFNFNRQTSNLTSWYACGY